MSHDAPIGASPSRAVQLVLSQLAGAAILSSASCATYGGKPAPRAIDATGVSSSACSGAVNGAVVHCTSYLEQCSALYSDLCLRLQQQVDWLLEDQSTEVDMLELVSKYSTSGL